MLNLTIFRRYAAYAGVVVAALASIATEGTPQTSSLSGDDKLSTESPEVAHHFTVNADRDHTLAASAQIVWDGVANGSTAELLVRVTGDGSQKSAEKTVTFADFVAGGRSPSAAFDQVSAGTQCGSSPCNQGYTVLVRLQNSAPGEFTALHWTVQAQLVDKTRSGSATVTED